MMHLRQHRLVVPFALLGALQAQGEPAAPTPITEAAVREVVGWLADDARAGRDTGSPELEAAADWLGEHFAAAGLEPCTEVPWFHRYTLPGLRLDSSKVRLQLASTKDGVRTAVEPAPGVDLRWWRPSDVLQGTDEVTTVAAAADPVLQQLLRAQSGRRPIVIEVPEDHPYWRSADGVHQHLGAVRGASRPVFLLRQGFAGGPLPKGDDRAWTATWSVPAAEAVDIPLRNVVGLRRGTGAKDEYVVVSAHYDHVGTGRPVDGDAIYNGADDNATGTTAVVLLARALAKLPPLQRHVLFVCFSAEERSLRGSAAFCQEPPVPLAKVVANLNLEMLGRPEPGQQQKAWITGADLSDFAAIAAPALQRGGVALVEFPMATQLFTASDNWSFAKQGVVAHSLSAGSLHQDYHQPGDEVGKLDVPHLTAIVRALVEVVQEFGNRDQAPQWNEKGKERLERGKGGRR
jgi:hypothetical protein